MRILNRPALESFKKAHANSRSTMDKWIIVVESARWSTTADLRATFDKADFVKGFTVFNVGGNNYRIVARIVYPSQTVLIIDVSTHAQYDRWKP
ncbi:MAG: type II toxin-antitoxin system HigB family toxin [Candidatus Melainabacteria bacterium]|nr:type II toxin-antitoxin system HigB family toxin [Candidatus Melainabacteria bacterium]